MKNIFLDVDNREERCHRCGGLGTIPTPDGKHNEICPMCGGQGIRPIPIKKIWK